MKNKKECDIVQKSKMDSTREYEAFVPKEDIENGAEYFAALDWALKQPDIHNIALSGPYGSGKSSVIKSYVKKCKKKDVVFVSLASFNAKENDNHGEDDENINTDCNMSKKLEEDIEKAVLEQLFYSVAASKIPKSRYRRIEAHLGLKSKIKTGLMAILVVIMLMTILAVVLPKNIKKIYNFAVSLGNLGLIAGVGAFFALVLLTFIILNWFGRSGSIKEIKILNAASIQGEANNNESGFNKNLDEIVYFFESTKKRLVIFEDLDRFCDTRIFVALRNLNTILNNNTNKMQKMPIRFIYAIKDDTFEKEGERTKFFDFIIPIIPYISSGNSGEILRDKLKVDADTKKSLLYSISENYINEISPYISNMRDLICMCNEFKIFKNTIKDNQKLDSLDDEKIFSLIMFKTLYPKEFSLLEEESESSIIRNVFQNKEKISKALDQEINKLTDEKTRIERDCLRSIRELKIVLLSTLAADAGGVFQVSTQASVYSLQQMLSDDFDINIFKNKSIEVYYCQNRVQNGAGHKSINDPESYIKDKGDYFSRIEQIKKGRAEKIKKLYQTIDEKEQRRNNIYFMTLKEIINEVGINFLEDKIRTNPLLVYLLRNGYIDETYENYINYFYPNSITTNDLNFVLSVRGQSRKYDYAYPLNSPEKVNTYLSEKEFFYDAVLNFSLIDYVLEHIDKNEARAEQLFMKLRQCSDESVKFTKEYVNRKCHLDILFGGLSKDNSAFWYQVSETFMLSEDELFQYLVCILKYADLEDIECMNESALNFISEMSDDIGEPCFEPEGKLITDLLIEDKDVLQKLVKEAVPIDKLIDVITILKIRFKNINIQGLDAELLSCIFEDNHYEINIDMLESLFEWKSFDAEGLYKRNYTTVKELNYSPLNEYIQDNFEEYVRNCVVRAENNKYESLESVQEIIELLADQNLELCCDLIKKEEVLWDDISLCLQKENIQENNRKALWDCIVENDKMKSSWKNLREYVDTYESSNEIVCHFERHIDEYISDLGIGSLDEKFKNKILHFNMSFDSFRKFVKEVGVDAIEDAVDYLSDEKIQVLIEEEALEFSESRWNELRKRNKNLCIEFAIKWREKFIQSLNSIALSEEEIELLLLDKSFTEEDKRKVLSKLDLVKLGENIAKVIAKLQFVIDKNIIEAAWKKLDISERKELLLNQLNSYDNIDLLDKFTELGDEYIQLGEKGSASLPYNNYNIKLVDLLEKKGFVSEHEVFESRKFKGDVQKSIKCRVRRRKILNQR